MTSEELYDYVREWQDGELPYRSTKFPLKLNREAMQNEGIGPGSLWWDQIVGKLERANTLGLDSAVGRQALAKCAAAVLALTQAAVDSYGPLPKPGVPSGYNLDSPMELS
jgi:hypothetical protein